MQTIELYLNRVVVKIDQGKTVLESKPCRVRARRLCPYQQETLPACHSCRYAEQDHKELVKTLPWPNPDQVNTHKISDTRTMHTAAPIGAGMAHFKHEGNEQGTVTFFYHAPDN